jgi:starvation-inducible DNA-binding protein
MTSTLESQAAPTAGKQAPLLQSTLVELIDLSLQGKQTHWNVVGPTFKPVHELLDEFVDAVRQSYDDVAERMTTIGVAPDGRSTTVADKTPLPQVDEGFLGDRAVVEAMADRIDTVSDRIRKRADEIGEFDLASQDLLIEVLRGLEKYRWMFRAHLG